MTTINQPIISTPTPQAPVTKPEVNFKGESNEQAMAEAIEKNTDTAKTCANVALATSVATLLPLSVLAYKTGKISKVATELEKNAKPILENMKGVTAAVKGTATNIEKATSELANSIKSEEWNKLLAEVRTKVGEMDGKALTEQLNKSIDELTQATSKKIGEVNPETVNNLVATIDNQLQALNVQGLSDDALKLINEIRERVKSFNIKFEVS